VSARNLAALILLAAIWGSSYLFIRVAVEPLGPLVVALSRVAVGGAGLAAYALAIGKRADLAIPDRSFFWLGLGNGAIPYFLIAFAELHLTASMAGILNATTPLFAALVYGAWNRERIAPRTSAGLALGMIGVGVLVGWDPAQLTVIVGLAVAAMLLSSLSYAATTVYAKRALLGVSSLRAALGQQIGASILLAPFTAGALAVGSGDGSPSVRVALALLALGLLCTSFAYLLYFHLIDAVGPVKTSTVTFLIPIFGILWSALFLDEAVRPVMLVGLALILSSVTLVTGQRVPGIRGRWTVVRGRATVGSSKPGCQ
jgi:drug/metabolite transporter (DMT)-like permease